jgi:GDP-L-fucose synthase
MEVNSKIYVAGHRGLVGSAIVRRLKNQGYNNIMGLSSKFLDLRDSRSSEEFFNHYKPDYVFMAAAKVGGINHNNTKPAEFIFENLQMQNNVIDNAYKNGTKKLLFLGSSCIYPKFSPQPIKEEYLMTGELEPTNEAYAIAKIAGIEMCKMYRRQYGFNAISAMPTNLYGINDNFNIDTSHVIPALINKFVNAKNNSLESVTLWGDGSPMREFLYSDDLADACIMLMNLYDEEQHINIGSNDELSISKLAQVISDLVEYKNIIQWDSSYPNGTPRKKLDNSKINSLGWEPKISIEDGIGRVIEWYQRTI